MKRLLTVAAGLVLLVTAGSLGSRAAAEDATADAETEFVCPPCGSDCDDAVHAAAGTCDMCGMAFVTRAEAERMRQRQAERKRAAILIFEGVQIIDFTGPYEVLGQANFDVVTVAKSTDPITTAMGMTVTPAHSFEDAPEVDVLVIPGGNVHDAEQDEATLTWLKTHAEIAEYTMSVCNGAFILAHAGLLDGGSATTFYGLIDDLREAAPKTTIVTDQRFVDNGRVMTTAGLSSGIDGTLHLIEKMYGRGRAQDIALHIEYDWQPDSRFARAALADMHLPRARIDGIDRSRTLSSQGDRRQWERSVVVESALSLGELAERVASMLEDNGWTRADAAASESGHDTGARSAWTFDDRDGGRWESAVRLAPHETDGSFLLEVTLSRIG